ncbi:MAG TPA: BTAD domain-containing putative transcriptional regulator [Gemmatimonadales bacterium]|jgi:serine/threonine-protein kinase|nr:BTAD domain-containing putative transcriptional regulator [Gemmatimonadales bacterium]
MIQLRMLGALHLTDADGRDMRALLAQPRRLALLAYLAATAPRDLHRRDHLLALFWPELDQAHARAALRQALHVLRDTLDPDVILSRGDEDIGLDAAQIRCDVVEFERAADRGQLADALDLYRGDLLEGFFIRGAPAFEQWLEDERARLKAVALRSASLLAEQSDARGNLTDSVQWTRRALRIAPLDEPTLRRLMQTLDRLGDRAGALEAYDAFAHRLTAELEAEPAPETRALAGAVRERVATLSSNATALAPIETAAGRPAPPRRSRRRWLGAGAALLGLAVVVAAVTRNPRAPLRLNAKRVLVVPFANGTGDSTHDRLGNQAADWITRGLLLTGVVDVADPGAMVLGAPTANVNRLAGHEAADVRARAVASGSGLAVSGSMYRRDDGIEFDAQITDEVSGRILRTLDPVLADPREPRPALALLRDRIMAALAEAVDPRLRELASSAGQPPRYDAYVAFSAGVEIFYGGRRARDALPYFQRAVALDSTYALPLIWAAWAHAGTALDQCDSTAAIARRLTRMRLTSLEQMQIDRVMARCRGDLPAAYALGRKLTEAVPRSELMWEQLARDALDFNHPREAVAILERLHPDSGALSGRAGFYNWWTSSYHLLGEHDRELEVAQHARQRFPRNLATLRVELMALAALGRVREVDERLDEINALPPDPIRLPAPVMRETALELAAHGDTAAARAALDRTLAWLAGRPAAEQATESFRFERALTHYAAGHADSARAIAAALIRAHPRSAHYAGLLGTLAAQRGDRPEAARIDRLLAGMERSFGRGQASYWRACIAAQLGERDAAVDLLGRALDAGYVYQVRFFDAHVEPSFATLRGYPRFEMLLRPKG